MEDDRQTPERAIIVAVAFIAVVTLAFGFVDIRKAIREPFGTQGTGQYKTPEQREEEAMALLKETDTDKDGLTDYDERFVLRTNPFLEDTDSDGVLDGAEVSANQDPNCPKGSTCQIARTDSGGGAGTDGTGSGTAAEPSAGEAEAQAALFVDIFGDPRELTREMAVTKLESLSPETLRGFFIRMGVPQEAVDKASDADLKALALDAFKEVTFANDLTPGSEGEPTE